MSMFLSINIKQLWILFHNIGAWYNRCTKNMILNYIGKYFHSTHASRDQCEICYNLIYLIQTFSFRTFILINSQYSLLYCSTSIIHYTHVSWNRKRTKYYYLAVGIKWNKLKNWISKIWWNYRLIEYWENRNQFFKFSTLSYCYKKYC